MPAGTREPLLHSPNFTEARSKFSALFDEAVRDEQPVVIVRSSSEHGMLLSRNAVLRLLEPVRLHVDVLPEDDAAFTLWLRELEIGGTGATLQMARDELVSAVCDYVRDYHQQFAFYRHLPDMAAKEPYVLRLSLAETERELLELLFPEKQPSPDSAKAIAISA